MEISDSWKKFETSGQIDDYMNFKYGNAVACSAPAGENIDATDDDGAGAASH